MKTVYWWADLVLAALIALMLGAAAGLLSAWGQNHWFMFLWRGR